MRVRKKLSFYITPRINLTLYKGHLPVGWGHLDPQDGKTWLGVAVAQGYAKKGYGSMIVKKLCEYADNAGWNLHLTCKKELTKWYQKFEFIYIERKNGKDYCYRRCGVYR